MEAKAPVGDVNFEDDEEQARPATTQRGLVCCL